MTTFRVSAADAGDFENERLAWDVLRAAAAHRARLPRVIELSECVMLKPYSIACLAAIGAKSPGHIKLRLPNDVACADHVIRIGLTKWFDVDDSRDSDMRPTNVIAEQVTNPSGGLSDRIIEVLSSELRLSGKVAPTLATHLDEVVLNALTHADSPIGCIVVGQAFPKRRDMEIAVVDLGQTIRSHLTSNPEHEDVRTDADAIILATQERVTGTVGANRWGEPNGGVGLYELRRYCECGGGQMSLLSGGHYVTFQEGRDPDVHVFKSYFAGCLVNVRFFER